MRAGCHTRTKGEHEVPSQAHPAGHATRTASPGHSVLSTREHSTGTGPPPGTSSMQWAGKNGWPRSLREATATPELCRLIINPKRPGRVEPRAIKRRPKEYDRLN